MLGRRRSAIETAVGPLRGDGRAGAQHLLAQLDAREGVDVAERGQALELEHVLRRGRGRATRPASLEDGAGAQVDRVAVADLDGRAGRDGEEDAEARRAAEQGAHARGHLGDAEEVADHRRVVEARRGRPLGHAHLGVDAGAHEVVDERRPEARLGHDPARARLAVRRRDRGAARAAGAGERTSICRSTSYVCEKALW